MFFFFYFPGSNEITYETSLKILKQVREYTEGYRSSGVPELLRHWSAGMEQREVWRVRSKLRGFLVAREGLWGGVQHRLAASTPGPLTARLYDHTFPTDRRGMTRENGKSVSPRSTWDTQTKVLSTVKEMRSGRTRKTEKQSKDIQIEQVVDTRQMTWARVSTGVTGPESRFLVNTGMGVGNELGSPRQLK